MIGVDHRQVVREITSLIPDYMVMGERGMADGRWTCRCRTTRPG
jgi:hypothetical protein